MPHKVEVLTLTLASAPETILVATAPDLYLYVLRLLATYARR